MDEALRAELLRRVEKDQDARKAPDFDRMREVDAENLPWLKAVVAERGWPGSSHDAVGPVTVTCPRSGLETTVTLER